MSITNECMVVNLQIGLWLGYRLDKEASRKVTSEANAADDTARVNKHIVPKESLKHVVSAANCVRSHFYTQTLPWKDNGDRLLTRKCYLNFVPEHARLVDAFHAAVETFLTTGYPLAKEQAAFRMGELFKDSDYPNGEALRHKFYVGMDIDAVVEAHDFRVAIDNAEEVKQQMYAAMATRTNRAMQDVWTRLADTLQHFASKMSTDDIFRDSTVKNLTEIVDLLPALNITDDPFLEQIRQDIATSLGGYAPKDLRTNPTTRAAAATDATRIMDQMAGFMNAFGNAP